jgi:hypothetical protein
MPVIGLAKPESDALSDSFDTVRYVCGRAQPPRPHLSLAISSKVSLIGNINEPPLPWRHDVKRTVIQVRDNTDTGLNRRASASNSPISRLRKKTL